MTRQSIRQQVSLSGWGWFTTLGTCIALGPLVEDRRYLSIAAGLLAVVVAVGVLLRLSRLARPVVLLVQVLVAAELVVLAFTDELFPRPDAYQSLAARFVSFGDQAQQYVAPMPRDADTTMAFAIIVLAVGLIVDLVGVTLRRVPVLGLLFLLIYMVPVAHLGGQVSLFSFVPGAVGFIFMLAADERERLTHWGRQIRTVNAVWHQAEPDVDDSGLSRSRFRIGFGAIGIAAVLPLLLPSFSPQILFSGGSNGTGPGPGDGPVNVDDPSLDMRRNLAEPSNDVLLRVTGRAEPAYFRLAALDDFSDGRWQVGDRPDDEAYSTDDEELPAPVGGSLLRVEPAAFRVEVTEDLETSWLPTPYAPRDITIDSSWLVDPVNFDVRADSEDDATGSTYDLLANIPLPSEPELRAAGDPGPAMDPFLDLPSQMPDIIEETARQATAGAGTGYEQAVALQSWFRDRGDYRYSLDQVDDDENRSGLDAVEAFLEERVGYCEQYASAMALMARQLGIPARVVVGFLRPESAGDGVWHFRGPDMHAWPELYFDEIGWVRFEPTPPSVSGPAPGFEDIEAPSASESTTAPLPSARPTRDLRSQPSAEVDAGAAGTGEGDSPWGTTVLVLSAALLLGLLALVPRLLREARTRRRWRSAQQPQVAAEIAWAELRDHMLDLRARWVDDGTPRHTGRALREQLATEATPDVVAALNRLVLAVERSRYARSVEDADLRPAVERVRAAMAGLSSPGRRRLATWLPASLWRSTSTGARGGRRSLRLRQGRESVLTLGE